VSGLTIDDLMAKYDEAVIARDFEVGIVQEAVVNAFGSKK
jgi:hypothetical protein